MHHDSRIHGLHVWLWIELGRYRYFESVSVFGIFVGIFFMSVRYSVSVFWNTSIFGIGIGISEILVENRQFLVYPTSIWRSCWGWPRQNFPFWKTTPWAIKTCHFVFDYNSGFSWSTFILFAPVESWRITLHRSLKNTTSHYFSHYLVKRHINSTFWSKSRRHSAFDRTGW